METQRRRKGRGRKRVDRRGGHTETDTQGGGRVKTKAEAREMQLQPRNAKDHWDRNPGEGHETRPPSELPGGMSSSNTLISDW